MRHFGKVLFDKSLIRNKNGVVMNREDDKRDISDLAIQTANQNNHDLMSNLKPPGKMYLK